MAVQAMLDELMYLDWDETAVKKVKNLRLGKHPFVSVFHAASGFRSARARIGTILI